MTLTILRALSKSQNWLAGPWLDQSFWPERNSKGFLLKVHLLRTYCLGRDWSSWIVLVKSEILNMTGMTWLVSSDKWRAPLRFYYICIFVLGSSICLDFPLSPCEPWPLSGVRWCYVQVKIIMLCLKELQFLIIRGLMVSDSSSSPPFRDNIISFARNACLFDNSFTAWKWGSGLLLWRPFADYFSTKNRLEL